MKVKINRLHESVKLPIKGSKSAACFDLYAHRIERIKKHLVKVHYGIATEIPEGYKAVIVPRSSFTHSSWIMANSPAQIDSDYRGELMSNFEAIPSYVTENNHLGYMPFPYREGDRCAQLYIEKVINVEFEETKTLTETNRGDGGFGSTGNH